MALITAVTEFLDELRGGRMSDAPVVRVSEGELRGRTAAGPAGRAFYSFYGVPYAKPPLGSLRFKAPEPPESWEGIRDATVEGNASAQIDPVVHKAYVGDENCLYLNVYTPNLDGAFLPVMLFIHGGGFRFGSGGPAMYAGDYLVEKDVVVVTINYRCGALGFLSLNTPEVPGNAGLKDMVQAIRWVKQNIHNFGGNAGNITIFGSSCGGVATSILTASPLTRDDISKAIIQSGTALNNWAFQNNPLDNAKSLAKLVGCESDDVDVILEDLRATSVKDIVEANEKLHTPATFFEEAANIFAPVIEKEFPGVEAVITEAFIDILTSGRVAQIPIMIGSTTLEFTYEKISDDLQDFIPQELNIERNTPDSIAISNKIKELYFKGNHTGVESLGEYFELVSDKLVNIDTHRYVQYLVKVLNKPIYYYKFDYVGELNLSKKLLASLGLTHAGHGDELGYLFKNELQSDVTPTAQDEKMRERMLRLWTNFAKSGNPTPDENHYINAIWQPVTKDNLYYFKLSNELSLNANPDKERMEFWDELYNKYYKIWDHPKTNEEQLSTTHVTTTYTETITESHVEEHESIEEQKEVAEEQLIEVEDTVPNNTAESVEESLIEVEQSAPEIVQANRLEEESAPVVTQDTQVDDIKPLNGNSHDLVDKTEHLDLDEPRKPRLSNEIKMVQNSNGAPRDVIRANDPPEDDLPKNIGVNKFVNFFESLGGKK